MIPKKTQDKIDTLNSNLADFLKYKNEKYGNSALEPLSVFPTNCPETVEICIRLNDKLARVKNSQELRKNDIVDIIGYLELLLIKKDWLTFDEFKD
jgi:hypothetical protein